MGTQLTWSEPVSESPILSYAIYRAEGIVSDLTDSNLLATVDDTVLFYEDFAYEKTVLEGVGYSYGIRARSARGYGELSNIIHVTYDFMGQ